MRFNVKITYGTTERTQNMDFKLGFSGMPVSIFGPETANQLNTRKWPYKNQQCMFKHYLQKLKKRGG